VLSDNGEHLVFYSGRSIPLELYGMDLVTGRVRRLSADSWMKMDAAPFRWTPVLPAEWRPIRLERQAAIFERRDELAFQLRSRRLPLYLGTTAFAGYAARR